MKQAFILATAAVMTLASCKGGGNQPQLSLEQETNDFWNRIDSIYSNGSLTESQQDSTAQILFEEAYRAHPADSLGLAAFKQLICGYWDVDKCVSEFEEAQAIIRESADMQRRIQARRNSLDQAPGMQFYDFSGADAITGDTISVSQFYGQGKRIIVDFWASWCSPCRQEIKNSLLGLASNPDYTVVGIAVWEDGIDDTLGAMEELGISWPVIYTGGRENSPSVKYGVTGIPTMFVLDENGTILGVGHNIESILDSID